MNKIGNIIGLAVVLSACTEVSMLFRYDPAREPDAPPTDDKHYLACVAETGTPISFASDVEPVLAKHCYTCHSVTNPVGGFAFDKYSSEEMALAEKPDLWNHVAEQIEKGYMPPPNRPAMSQNEKLVIQRWVARVDGQDSAKNDPGYVPPRRLSHTEYRNTMRDLLGYDPKANSFFKALPADAAAEGFDNNAFAMAITASSADSYMKIAEAGIEALFASKSGAQYLSTVDCNIDSDACLRQVVQNFLDRAFRRPATTEEVNNHLVLFGEINAEFNDRENSLKLLMQGILVSPNFLYRIESDVKAGDHLQVRELNDFELASRISYFLWSTMPDQQLFSLAKAGQLKDSTVVRQEIKRMLKDPRSNSLRDSFAHQWLQLNKIDNVSLNTDNYPEFDDSLKTSMAQESLRLFDHIIKEDLSFEELISADYTFLNSKLSDHYGIASSSNGVNDFVKVSLASTPRRGILNHASFLSINSKNEGSSPVKRGAWILDRVLCGDLSEPPAVPPLPPANNNDGKILTVKERLNAHRINASCISCHAHIDPLGLALEAFGPGGEIREIDENGLTVDPTSVLPSGESVADHLDIIELIKQKDDYGRCITKKLMTYATGRKMESFDKCSIEAAAAANRQSNYRVSDIVFSILQTEAMRKRRSFKVEESQ